MSSARDKVGRVAENWFLTEPLFFAVWTSHRLEETTHVDTIRVGRGCIEYNPSFINSLDRKSLTDVLLFEVMRIVLGHPYRRRQEDAQRAYLASNLAVQELLQTALPIPRAAQLFQSREFDGLSFEFYYHMLRELKANCAGDNDGQGLKSSNIEKGISKPCAGDKSGEGKKPQKDAGNDSCSTDACDTEGDTRDADQKQSRRKQGRAKPSPNTKASADPLEFHANPEHNGVQNTRNWDRDELLRATLTEIIQRIHESNNWGSVGGQFREQILASLRPKLNYRDVLRLFRASILSSKRRLTRMKPNRRYGFLQMGSRYDFCTRLLFAVDVSGSMGSEDLRRGFSVINQFFRYGVPVIDVVQFDTEVRDKPLTLRKARHQVTATGRGGTDFQPIMDYLDQHRDYDGLIIFTDGIAPVPRAPQNRHTRVLWLFKTEETWKQMNRGLRELGKTAFLQVGKT